MKAPLPTWAKSEQPAASHLSQSATDESLGLQDPKDPNQTKGTDDDFRRLVAEREHRDRVLDTILAAQRNALYWKSKEGKCLACKAEIAREDQYCPSCESFLLETLPTIDPNLTA